MELTQLFKSVLDADTAPVVICNLQHDIVYMNPCAMKRYAYRGGSELVGKSIFECHNDKANEMIKRVVAWFEESARHNIIHTFKNKKENKDVYMVALRDDNKNLIGYYEKHEYRNAETASLYDFKA